MKVREFDIKNYDVTEWYLEQISKHFENFSFLGIKYSPKSSRYDIEEKTLTIENLKNYEKEIIKYFQEKYEVKKEGTIKNYEKVYKLVSFILFDDKDFVELIKVLEDSYYCQATTALNQLLDNKLKGKTAKSLKYQIRQQQFSNISCD